MVHQYHTVVVSFGERMFATMRSDLLTYFSGESTGGMILVIIASFSFVLSGWLYSKRHIPHARSAIGPLLVIAVLELIVGGVIWGRTESQVVDLLALLDTDATLFVNTELTRIAGVRRSLAWLHLGELVVLVGSALMFPWTMFTKRYRLQGFVLALGLQAGIVFGIDGWAATRAQMYERDLLSFDANRPRSLAGPRGRAGFLRVTQP